MGGSYKWLEVKVSEAVRVGQGEGFFPPIWDFCVRARSILVSRMFAESLCRNWCSGVKVSALKVTC